MMMMLQDANVHISTDGHRNTSALSDYLSGALCFSQLLAIVNLFKSMINYSTIDRYRSGDRDGSFISSYNIAST